MAAPLPEDNIDTDIIYPARFLLITAREGLGRYAFHDHRFDADGRERPDFVLNREPWRQARIVIAGANFGSGSSREQAVWALLGQGIRCIVAPSFGEIFQGNCYRNGVLPIVLDSDRVTALHQFAAAGKIFTVDLEAMELVFDGGVPIDFVIGEEQRLALLNGWDETTMILNRNTADVELFEQRHRAVQPWLFATEAMP